MYVYKSAWSNTQKEELAAGRLLHTLLKAGKTVHYVDDGRLGASARVYPQGYKTMQAIVQVYLLGSYTFPINGACYSNDTNVSLATLKLFALSDNRAVMATNTV